MHYTLFHSEASIFWIRDMVLSHFSHSPSGSLPFRGSLPPSNVPIPRTRCTPSLIPTIPHLPIYSSAVLTAYCSFLTSSWTLSSIGRFSARPMSLDTVLG